MRKSRRVRIARLNLSPHRDPLDHSKVKLYRLALRRGEKFPPIEISDVDDLLWIEDGYHRYYAHKLEGRKMILATAIVTDRP
jgi:hypothetical protein